MDEVEKREKSAKERSGKGAKAETEKAVQDAIDEAMIPQSGKKRKRAFGPSYAISAFLAFSKHHTVQYLRVTSSPEIRCYTVSF